MAGDCCHSSAFWLPFHSLLSLAGGITHRAAACASWSCSTRHVPTLLFFRIPHTAITGKSAEPEKIQIVLQASATAWPWFTFEAIVYLYSYCLRAQRSYRRRACKRNARTMTTGRVCTCRWTGRVYGYVFISFYFISFIFMCPGIYRVVICMTARSVGSHPRLTDRCEFTSNSVGRFNDIFSLVPKSRKKIKSSKKTKPPKVQNQDPWNWENWNQMINGKFFFFKNPLWMESTT